MKLPKLALLASLLLAAPELPAQSFVLVHYVHRFSQTGSATVVESTATPWMLRATIDGPAMSASYPTGPVQVTDPNLNTFALNPPGLNDPGWFYHTPHYATLGALTTNHPTGTWSMQFNGNTWNVPMTASSFAPAAPVASLSISGLWVGDTLMINPSDALAGFTLSSTWSSGFVGGSSRVGITIERVAGVGPFSNIDADNADTFLVNSTTVNLAPGALLAGNLYRVDLEFNSILGPFTELESGAFIGVAANTVATQFFITVIPEPATTTALVAAAMLGLVLVYRRRSRPVA